MIVLHRLAHAEEPFHLNPDLIATVEAHPDTVVVLTTGAKVVVIETPEQVSDAIHEWRVSILAEALRRDHRPAAGGSGPARLAPVEAFPPTADHQ